jgi:hypothetical protein
MPNRETETRPADLTLDQVEQVGRMLTPAIAQALRPEFHKLREDVTATMLRQKEETDDQVAALHAAVQAHGNRIGALENFRWRLWGMWTGASAVVVFILEHVWNGWKK